MLIRLAIIWIVVAGFAAGFSELVTADGQQRGARNASPCDEWSNPDCARPATAAPAAN